MNPQSNSWAKGRLTRADLITERLKAADGLREIASEMSLALSGEIGRNRYIPVTGITQMPRDEGVWSPPEPGIFEGFGLGFRHDGGLRGSLSLEDLLAEIIAAGVSPQPFPGGKRHERPSFAFLLAGLSAFGGHEGHDDLIRIGEAARAEAAELAASAVQLSRSDTLGDLQRGIVAAESYPESRTNFSRHVAGALKATRNLTESNQDQPRKGQVRRETRRLLISEGFVPFDESDTARWREVFAAAGLKDLPQERVKRGKSRHADG